MKITKRQLRRIIKEAIGDGFEEMKASLGPGPQKISAKPTGRVEVEWDFEMDDDDEWNALSYDEQQTSEGIPDVIELPANVMSEFTALATDHGESQAEDLVTDWLSDEHGWLHQGWSWV